MAPLVGCSVAPKVEANPRVQALEITTEQEMTIQAAEIAAGYGDYDEAMRLFKEVLQDNPVATDAFVGIGDIYLAKREWNFAVPFFLRK